MHDIPTELTAGVMFSNEIMSIYPDCMKKHYPVEYAAIHSGEIEEN